MKEARWQKLEASALREQLRQAGEALRRVIPVYIEKQCEALKCMAETAIVASGGQVPQKKDDYEQ